MAKRVKRPTCFMCGKRPARVLEIPHPDGEGYFYQAAHAAGRVFCSQRCAAAWGAGNFWDMNDGLHWCLVTQTWEFCAEDSCEHCSPQKEEEDDE